MPANAGAGIIAGDQRVVLKIVVIGLTWSLFQHLLSGLRHFVLDIGAGFELKNNNLWSILTPLIALAATVVVWTVILLK